MTTIATLSSGVDPSKLEQEMSDMDAGVLKDIPAKSPLTINGAAMTQAQIDAQLKSYIATFVAADTAKTAYQAAVLARTKVQVEARDFYLQLKKAIIAYFGSQAPQLADFGLTPAKAKAAKTSAEKAVIAAKAALTREARGTTSKKQKLKINPGTGTPLLSLGAGGKQITAPTVVSPQLPESSTSSSTSTSTTATSASAPAPAGSGGPASNA
jgi:hypothetical protein